MNPLELKKKIERGERLSPVEWALLEAYLEDGKSSPVAEAVRRLPVEAPSMAWRSKLNERLLEIAPKGRRSLNKTRWFAISAGAASVCALAVAVVLFTHQEKGIRGHALGENTAAILIQWHEEAAASTILPSDGTRLEGLRAADAPHEPTSEIERLLYESDALKTL